MHFISMEDMEPELRVLWDWKILQGYFEMEFTGKAYYVRLLMDLENC